VQKRWKLWKSRGGASEATRRTAESESHALVRPGRGECSVLQRSYGVERKRVSYAFFASSGTGSQPARPWGEKSVPWNCAQEFKIGISETKAFPDDQGRGRHSKLNESGHGPGVAAQRARCPPAIGSDLRRLAGVHPLPTKKSILMAQVLYEHAGGAGAAFARGSRWFCGDPNFLPSLHPKRYGTVYALTGTDEGPQQSAWLLS